MDTPWLEQANLRIGEMGRQFSTALDALSEPHRLHRIRYGLCALAAVWMVFGLAQLVWSLVPPPDPGAVPEDILNPLVEPSRQGSRRSVAIDEVAQWALFGTAATPPAQVVAAAAEELELTPAGGDDLDGIENNARETKLALTLQGVLNSTDADRALAIIEAKREQDQYSVGDELPVGNKVTLAKILPDRVVLDNGGKYELLLLFGENSFGTESDKARNTASGSFSRSQRPTATPAATSGEKDVREMAESYRRRLYENPQSLAQVVRIAPVRDGTELRGYRVSAGRDREQFEALGFRSNDVVTGVNGIALTDPGKGIELYRVMRTANEASFDVLRDGEELTLVVDLADSGPPADGAEGENVNANANANVNTSPSPPSQVRRSSGTGRPSDD